MEVSDAKLELLYDKIHLEELKKGGRMGEIRLRAVRRFNQETGLSAELDALRGELAAARRNVYIMQTKHLGEAEATIAQLRDRVAALEEGLRRIANGDGHCGTCGEPCGAVTMCECRYSQWEPDDPKDCARALLTQNEVG